MVLLADTLLGQGRRARVGGKTSAPSPVAEGICEHSPVEPRLPCSLEPKDSQCGSFQIQRAREYIMEP